MSEDHRDAHDTLVPRAFLHDDPEAYLAGVEDTLAELNDDDSSGGQVRRSG